MINKSLYPSLIFVIWLVAYLLCSNYLGQFIEWDEAKYLACARGIAENFDFSSRSTTIQGLLKYGFPQHTTHYPLHSLYIAIFFKLFGASLGVAIFSTWFALFLTCIFIYFIMLLLTENNNQFSFFTSITFLFLPRVINHSNSVMMEIPCCALLTVLIFLVFKLISKDKLNPFILAVSTTGLLFYKSLFVGVVFGFLSLLIFGYVKKSVGFKWLSSLLYLVITFVLYFLFTKFVFLPLAPWIDFSRIQQGVDGAYADFDGGFFRDPVNNAIAGLKSLYMIITTGYFPSIPVDLDKTTITGCFVTSPIWLETGLYFLILFYVIVFLFFLWKKLLPVQRIFILFSVISVLTFNIIFNILIETNLGPRCRYNFIYVPLLLISSAVLIWSIRDSFKKEYKNVFLFVLISLIVVVYFPVYNAGSKITSWNKNLMNEIMTKNTEIVKKYIGASRPIFIYSTSASFVTWDMFPTREIFAQAKNDYIKKINTLLPKPVEYLFITPKDYLFNENKDLILMAQPIIDNWYTFYGVDVVNNVVVYRLNPRIYEREE